MSEILTPLLPEYTIQIPDDALAFIFLGIWLIALIFILIRIRIRELKFDRRRLLWLAGLSVLLLVCTPFFGIRLPIEPFVQSNFLPVNHLMFLAAVPWMVASGVLGPVFGVVLAGMSGVLLAYFDTHHIFTPMIFMTLALIFGWLIHQRFRTVPYKILRFPIAAAFVSLLVSLPLIFSAVLVTLQGEFAQRMVVSLAAMPGVLLALAGMILVGGILSVVVRALIGEAWGGSGALKPAPGETSLKFRLLATTVPVLLILLFALVYGMLKFNQNAVKRETIDRLTETAAVISESFPLFIETGESLLQDLAENSDLNIATPEQAVSTLKLVGKTSSYFDQLILLNEIGHPFASYPPGYAKNISQILDQGFTLDRVLNNSLVNIYPSAPSGENHGIDLNFFVKLDSPNEGSKRILWGRTSLLGNSLTRSTDNLIKVHEGQGGVAYLLNEASRILYHTDPSREMQVYTEDFSDTPTYYEGISPDGGLMLQYFQPVDELGWTLFLAVPSQAVAQRTWQITYPVLLFGIGAMAIVLITVLAGLTPLTRSINRLTDALKTLSTGSYEVNVAKKRPLGELGQLTDVFAGVAGSLRNRVMRQSDLYSVSKGISGQQNLGCALDVIMKAALAQGVSSVRIVLTEWTPGSSSVLIKQSFGLGKYTGSFAVLDSKILSHSRLVGTMILQGHQIEEILPGNHNLPTPAAIIALPLKWENSWLGVLWVTYQDQQALDPEMVEFFRALSQKASAAIVTLKSLEDSKAMRRQMESVMDMLSDAVLIVDENDLVVYHNALAQSMFDKEKKSLVGTPFNSLVRAEEPIEFLTGGGHSEGSKDLQLKDGSVYQKIVSPVELANRKKGQVILLKDITRRKKTDSLKTEFVTMVSHELRSPLTLIHGYAKILRLTGNLNEQQDSSVSKIIDGIEEMKHLVQNLLDIGRLEAGTSLELSQLSLDNFAQKVVDGMDAQAKQKNVTVKLSLPEHPVVMEADATFLTQALKNLLDNAIKFSKMGGEVGLQVQVQDDQVIFVVRDEGIGIAPLDQRNIFNKFQRTSSLVGQENSGSGLGLAIVRSVAERHGGKVWLESQLGKGSSFYLAIPRQGN